MTDIQKLRELTLVIPVEAYELLEQLATMAGETSPSRHARNIFLSVLWEIGKQVKAEAEAQQAAPGPEDLQ